MKVCEKVQKKGVTTYNEVADELVAEFSSTDNHISPNDAVSPSRSLNHCPHYSFHSLLHGLFCCIKKKVTWCEISHAAVRMEIWH